ncbi:unnamed protein product [Prorocentrum cordatum]|uniref:Uncharacterized protein n=1 Tax=Prorocentrum cordatum TaxID=2364126 RepID=A0ABN9P7N1_9DINO|nr:unnamed protein product [Polarella glacialis]
MQYICMCMLAVVVAAALAEIMGISSGPSADEYIYLGMEYDAQPAAYKYSDEECDAQSVPMTSSSAPWHERYLETVQAWWTLKVTHRREAGHLQYVADSAGLPISFNDGGKYHVIRQGAFSALGWVMGAIRR